MNEQADDSCVSDSHYTKTIQFQDINYQLSQNEDKTAILEGCGISLTISTARFTSSCLFEPCGIGGDSPTPFHSAQGMRF